MDFFSPSSTLRWMLRYTSYSPSSQRGRENRLSLYSLNLSTLTASLKYDNRGGKERLKHFYVSAYGYKN
ncbi:hypothetical protein [Rhabdochlamydiaceae symbiont of Dictyostelium giganteum]|uniref:hypothetical protein n=1 Tax=Rhabdochlamydiaceae symbiont of Dictyostelium giganteum TaxID=3342349 RepID=UPI00384B4C1F